MRLNIAVFAPMPKPRISTAVMVKPGDLEAGGVCDARQEEEVIGD
jgi:hypothetical protein